MPNVFQNLASCKRVFREIRMLSSFKHDNDPPRPQPNQQETGSAMPLETEAAMDHSWDPTLLRREKLRKWEDPLRAHYGNDFDA
ncbi:hypothetical protein ANCDUO_18032 [Ancylostoma duodenale]|uniref:Uncharacterized protein n=1 Tax=Ancylostoma duodenale TaxID=51022 RepID=A0A0C2C6I2_9BILA|nr:hypothetical protein ANCDUO_18032 [Ancylostoma duodenale]